jgi:deoxyribodipyrimidine photo-lyase
MPEVERYGIVDRAFYPPEMSNARCHAYNANTLPRPIEQLAAALLDTAPARAAIPVQDAVVHWFKSDLRTADNHALHLAATKAHGAGVPLVCLYIVSPQDFAAHVTSAARVDFIRRSLTVLQADLAALDVPLHIDTVAQRAQVPARVLELCGECGAAHLYANMEYEVDELRREAALVRAGVRHGISVDVVHDTCVVPPGDLRSGSGSQYAVYTPWFRAWARVLHAEPARLALFATPGRNAASARTRFGALFAGAVPQAPEGHSLEPEQQARLGKLWPAGERAANERLRTFIAERIVAYADDRDFPAAHGTAGLSVHLAAGTLSARTAVVAAREAGGTARVDGGGPGVAKWISEVAWRDFYRHILAHWPYVWYGLLSIAALVSRPDPPPPTPDTRG